ncbi:MAG: division/cell wall cluster transcriptional repressor MraZ [Deltaproteobacteria bacterium]|nr:division/cell wall cluster transcriptional repressor MraZ [Deltaproteobacteria bacterium]MBW1955306.1 division/cell wall cluster transcriptional repressor MraZ [Deltaproteobacteria bacterium]MBW2040903.1 division/cell wall cluster transcriptional repressor MraZ [Deltaproteobacteria bacterium]MBW2131001.1 division/cell wall cluster transcriptional repressor MraZ [Deltaproteobacteria bacterium]
MFRGSSFHTVDDKGRLVIPARFREVIGNSGADRLMLSRLDKCLHAYTFEEWKKVEAKILSLAETSDNMRRFRRVFIGGASDCPFDRQGRMLIPPLLRQYAGIEKDVVLVGVLDHFEIWSRANWDKENVEMEQDMKKEEVRNEIAKLGI